MPELFHYTCDHRFPMIVRDGLIKPFPVLGSNVEAVWMTDLETPDRKGLGLTSRTLDCDRLAHQLRIVNPQEVLDFRGIRKLLHPLTVEMLVWGPEGTLPMHWYLSLRPQKFEVVR